MQPNYVTKAVALFTPSEIVRIGRDLGIELPARGLRLLTEGEEIDTAKAFPNADDQKAADMLFHAMAMGKVAHTGERWVLVDPPQQVQAVRVRPDPVPTSDQTDTPGQGHAPYYGKASSAPLPWPPKPGRPGYGKPTKNGEKPTVGQRLRSALKGA